jgi:hypothetical protein
MNHTNHRSGRDQDSISSVRRHYRISLCTTCMDRLSTLQQVLPANIRDNQAYVGIEFVLLDYHSHDGVSRWVRGNLMEYIESGLLQYYRTTEPQYYHPAHSRNVALRLATGDIVNSVDADNFVGPGFADHLNRWANEYPQRVVFARARTLPHGRIGFYKREFIDILGGYDEDLDNYGYEDYDLLHRAVASGFTLLCYGDRFVRRIPTPRNLVHRNMANHNWKMTEKMNRETSERKIRAGLYKANEGRAWGKATVVRNFTRQLQL